MDMKRAQEEAERRAAEAENLNSTCTTNPDPDLSVLFGQQHKHYNMRTSSAYWDTAPASFNFNN